ncbi:MAG: hypothetical protein ACK55I_47200, partial [bacterium]
KQDQIVPERQCQRRHADLIRAQLQRHDPHRTDRREFVDDNLDRGQPGPTCGSPGQAALRLGSGASEGGGAHRWCRAGIHAHGLSLTVTITRIVPPRPLMTRHHPAA